MKFVALTALIATASAASDWAICSAASDCTTAGSKCCSASNTGKATVKICAPSATVVVPNGIVTYQGYTVSCSAKKSTSSEATGANRLIAGASSVVAAIYLLA